MKIFEDFFNVVEIFWMYWYNRECFFRNVCKKMNNIKFEWCGIYKICNKYLLLFIMFLLYGLYVK